MFEWFYNAHYTLTPIAMSGIFVLGFWTYAFLSRMAEKGRKR